MSSITTAIAGFNGSVSGTPGSGTVGSEIVEWSLDDTVEDLNATSMSSGGYYDNVEGIQKATGSYTAIGTPPTKGDVTALTLAVGTTTGDATYIGDILITSKAMTIATEGSVVTYVQSFVFRGSYAEGTVA